MIKDSMITTYKLLRLDSGSILGEDNDTMYPEKVGINEEELNYTIFLQMKDLVDQTHKK